MIRKNGNEFKVNSLNVQQLKVI